MLEHGMMRQLGSGGGSGGLFNIATTSIYILNGNRTATLATAEKMNVSNESCSAISSSLPVAVYGVASVATTTKAYSLGGHTGSDRVAEIQGMDMTTDTSFNPASTMQDVLCYFGAGVNTNEMGIVMGGANGTGAYANLNNMQALVFSTETSIRVTSGLSRVGYTSVSKGTVTPTAGYTNITSSATKTTDMAKYLFGTTTATIISNGIDIAKLTGAAFQTTTKGYSFGGSTSSSVNDISGFNMATDTNLSLAITAAVAMSASCGGETTTNGYSLGGYTSSYSSDIQGMNLTNETVTNTSATLTATRGYAGSANK